MEHLRTSRASLAAEVLLRRFRANKYDLRRFTSENRTRTPRDQRYSEFRSRVSSGPNFQEFIRRSPVIETAAVFADDVEEEFDNSYLPPDLDSGKDRKGSPGYLCTLLGRVE